MKIPWLTTSGSSSVGPLLELGLQAPHPRDGLLEVSSPSSWM